jgi:hypothetical protein
LPPAWYADWATAFLDAPIESSRGGDSHWLGEHLRDLVDSDPGLVEAWLAAHLATDFSETLLRLPRQAEATMASLPRERRDRLMRRFAGEGLCSHLLALLVGDDAEWLGSLLDDGVITHADAQMSLGSMDHRSDDRAAHLLLLSPPLVSRGMSPEGIAQSAMFGTFMGTESDRHESVRAAFAREPVQGDPGAEQVRQAGMRIFEGMRDMARAKERQQAIDGQR